MVFGSGKRGQFTIIVILGIVLFFIFTFAIYARTLVIRSQMDAQASKEIQNYINQNSINQYVTSCLDAVADEAIIRASMQNGIFEFDEDEKNTQYVSVYNEIYNRTVNVSVVLFPNNVAKENCVVRLSPPEYPYENTSIYMLEQFYYDNCRFSGSFIKYSGFFGFNNLTKLCNWNGSNKLNSGASSYFYQSCESGTYSQEDSSSIQENMEKFIEGEISNCVDFTVLNERTGANITVQDDESKVEITFGKNNIQVKLNYPLTFETAGKKAIIKMIDFKVEKNIRFKEVYDYVFQMLRKDSTDPGFNMIEDRGNALFYDEYSVKKIKTIHTGENLIDVMEITDNKTKIQGMPLIFYFAVKNRGPALDYIHETSDNKLYDLAYIENETIILMPQGYDPDDDNLTYEYSLWKETYDEYYDFENPNCLGSSIEYVIANCMSNKNEERLHNWTKSGLFLETSKDANYTLIKEDTGFHLVKILIKEYGRQQLKDWQTIRILVFDLPVANITGTNFYEDIDNSLASTEDPYFFDGSSSTVSIGSLSHFIWNDSLEFYVVKQIVYPDSYQSKTLTIPNETNNILYNITNIKPLNFSILGEHNISLTVNTTDGREDMTKIQLNVVQCLPHRNSSNSAFPYNKKPFDFWDAFYANHTCCTDDLMYAGTGVECYRNETYGGDKSFFDFITREPLPPNNQVNYDYGIFTGNYDNDIYFRTFIRNCSGDRGNICNGTAVETRTVVEACADTNSMGGTERCSGPPIDVHGKFIDSNLNPGCTNYLGQNTFEKYAGYSGATGKCNSAGVCSDGTTITGILFPSSGPFKCNATCDGNGGCTVAVDCVCSGECGANDYCNNIPKNILPKLTGKCIYSPFELKCISTCQTETIINVCKNSTFDSCTAYGPCGNHPPGYYLGNGNYCTSICAQIYCRGFEYDILTNSCGSTCTEPNIGCASGYKCTTLHHCVPS